MKVPFLRLEVPEAEEATNDFQRSRRDGCQTPIRELARS